VGNRAVRVAEILDQLESHYGKQSPTWPTDPYEFLIWWHCGYPASDKTCAKGWNALHKVTSIAPQEILNAGVEKLTGALKAGGMVPELRALRLTEIAMRVQNEFAGDLRTGLTGSIQKVRAILKKFPNIADPGADRILLFAGLAPIAAVPSNCPHVLVRILKGQERENYGVTYREAQQAIEVDIPARLEARARAYLLLKQHGQTLCKRTKPKCDECPVSKHCQYFAGINRGRAAVV